MLMLSRKTNEAIMIGDDIRVTITHIGRGRVQVAVDAPREVRVRRHELLDSVPTKVATPRIPAAVDFADSAAVVA
ncbi:MAG: carbon storage regulator [Pirellula sp.]|nr:carbon storage regulator [Pirellula sp.]